MILTILGAVVLVVAVYALGQHTKGKSVSDAAATRSSSARTSAAPSSSAKSSAKSKSKSSSSSSQVVPPAGSGSPAGTDASSAAKQIPIVVLNNTTTSGLAKEAAARFRDGGWTVSDTGNLRNDIASTCAYYDPSADGAKAAAQALQDQYPTIKRVAKRFAELPDAPVVVVLTPDYSSN